MFGLGFTEILLIAIIALLFIGPDKLPETMKSIARTIGKLKKALDDTKSTFEQELRVDDLRQEVMQYRAELDKAKNDLSAFKNIANREIDDIKQSAQLENFKPTDINDEKLFNDMFKEAEADFEALESDEKTGSFKNLKDEPKRETSKDRMSERNKNSLIEFKHLKNRDEDA